MKGKERGGTGVGKNPEVVSDCSTSKYTPFPLFYNLFEVM
jgi:hypothetical protein